MWSIACAEFSASARSVISERSTPPPPESCRLSLGNLTRLAQFYTHSEKTYEGVIRFGFATDTYDADGEPTTPPQEVRHPIARRSERWPPSFRASSSRCRRLFPPRKLPESPPTNWRARTKKSSSSQYRSKLRNSRFWMSTAIRPLSAPASPRAPTCGRSPTIWARNWAAEPSGRLRRTAVAEFAIEDAHTLEALEAAMQQGTAESLIVVHPRKLVPQLPCVTATEESAALIRTGRAVNLPEMSRAPAGQGLLRTTRTDRHRHQNRGDALPPEDCFQPIRRLKAMRFCHRWPAPPTLLTGKSLRKRLTYRQHFLSVPRYNDRAAPQALFLPGPRHIRLENLTTENLEEPHDCEQSFTSINVGRSNPGRVFAGQAAQASTVVVGTCKTRCQIRHHQAAVTASPAGGTVDVCPELIPSRLSSTRV